LNPRLWPFVKYGRRNLLPAIAGVYCVMSSSGTPLYIGQSVNICQRWQGHHLKMQLKAGASLHIAYRETFSEVGRLKMEAILIRHHRPRLNINLLPRLPKVAGIAAGQSRAMNDELLTTELTAAQVAERLDVSPATVRLWCSQGRFNSARLVAHPRGDYWVIPEGEINDFEPPKMGRPPKSAPSTQKPATGQIRRSNGTATKRKGGKK